MAKLTDINGVYAAGIHAGIKAKKKDLGYIYVPGAVASAGCYTQNKFVAPCVTYTQKAAKRNVFKAVVVNSGNANAGTGKEGMKNAQEMAAITAEKLNLRSQEVAVSSTGIIGKPLPMDVIETGLSTLLQDPKQHDTESFAEAILTTDLCTKTCHIERKIGRKTIVVSAVAKGSGMIAPNMGTMLAYVVTNAHMSSDQLQRFLSASVTESFNQVSVDGDTSTNDMVVAFATGEKKFSFSNKAEVDAFQALLTEVCVDLAKKMARDGEGATRLMEICVRGAKNHSEARAMALNIANSPLVKTAVHGADPNWGRVLAAAGKDPALKFNGEKVDLSFNGVKIVDNGQILAFDRAALADKMDTPEMFIDLDLHLGAGEGRAWGCDLSKGYIDINTAYS